MDFRTTKVQNFMIAFFRTYSFATKYKFIFPCEDES